MCILEFCDQDVKNIYQYYLAVIVECVSNPAEEVKLYLYLQAIALQTNTLFSDLCFCMSDGGTCPYHSLTSSAKLLASTLVVDDSLSDRSEQGELGM